MFWIIRSILLIKFICNYKVILNRMITRVFNGRILVERDEGLEGFDKCLENYEMYKEGEDD